MDRWMVGQHIPIHFYSKIFNDLMHNDLTFNLDRRYLIRPKRFPALLIRHSIALYSTVI